MDLRSELQEPHVSRRLSVGLAQGGMANHDTVLGARNAVGISGASLGLTIAGLGSAFHPYGIAISLQLTHS